MPVGRAGQRHNRRRAGRAGRHYHTNHTNHGTTAGRDASPQSPILLLIPCGIYGIFMILSGIMMTSFAYTIVQTLSPLHIVGPCLLVLGIGGIMMIVIYIIRGYCLTQRNPLETNNTDIEIGDSVANVNAVGHAPPISYPVTSGTPASLPAPFPPFLATIGVDPKIYAIHAIGYDRNIMNTVTGLNVVSATPMHTMGGFNAISMASAPPPVEGFNVNAVGHVPSISYSVNSGTPSSYPAAFPATVGYDLNTVAPGAVSATPIMKVSELSVEGLNDPRSGLCTQQFMAPPVASHPLMSQVDNLDEEPPRDLPPPSYGDVMHCKNTGVKTNTDGVNFNTTEVSQRVHTFWC